MDSITRIKDFIRNNFPVWEKVDYSQYEETVDFRKDQSELYKINNEEVILISYTNIGITGTDRPKPQIRVFLDEYKKPFYFAKKHQLRFYLFTIFTKDDEMAKGLNNFNPKEYIISIETNLDNEDSRRDLRSIYDYANEKLNGKKFLKCTRANYKADINQASFIYIGSPEAPYKDTFENFINIFDSRPYINSKNETSSQLITNIIPTLEENDYSTYITAIRTKPFLLLAGISGTGKSRIVRELAFKSCPKYLQDKDGTTPGNYFMIEVKPNWHDSTELLGYYSNLSKGYQFKKFVKFLVKAKLNPDVPFFICLDEMNLAPVEHYFAEILSILETRKHPKKKDSEEFDMDLIKTGAIVESQYFKEIAWKDKDGALHQKADMSDKDWYEFFFDVSTMSDDEKKHITKYQYKRTLQTEGLTLPDNVIIIGTVNMDDTTHQFSRKVIDRAMTIEMNGGKLSDMYGGSKDLEYLDDAEQEKWQNAFKQRYVTADEVLTIHENVAKDIIDRVPNKLEEINKALKGTPFEVSYRVLNELTIMIGVMLDEKDDSETLDTIIDKAIDRILLMKILPRIEGDSDLFKLKKAVNIGEKTCHNRLEWLKELAPDILTNENEPHQQTAREKIQEMIERLGNQEFTRFWP
ncbi:MAG: restriction endonuclease [Prevotella sp.]|nr:restriction endonuclease [Prevotella sp.]